jgi:hypothetical protein
VIPLSVGAALAALVTRREVLLVTAFLRTVDGEGFADDGPRTFPR